jgi:hypothetical protein
VVTQLGNMLLEAKIMTDTHVGKVVLILRICLTLKGTRFPFILERR